MPKLVKKKTGNFTIMSNVMFHDNRLNAKDIGILCTMLSYADGWKFSIKRLAKDLPDGETAIANSLKRIEKAHYLKRRRIYKDGKIVDWEYIISDEPMEKDTKGSAVESVETVNKSEKGAVFVPSLDDENLDVENQDVENLDLEKPDNLKISSKKESRNKKSSDKVSINHSAETKNFQQDFQQKKTDRNDNANKYNENRSVIEQVIKENIDYDWYK